MRLFPVISFVLHYAKHNFGEITNSRNNFHIIQGRRQRVTR